MHHIHATKFKNGAQVGTSLLGFRGIPDSFSDANEARKFSSQAHARMNRTAKAGVRYEVEATGTPEWWLAVDESLKRLNEAR